MIRIRFFLPLILLVWGGIVPAQAGERLFVDAGMMTMNDSWRNHSLGDRSFSMFAGVESDWGWSRKFGAGVISGAWVIGLTAESWRDLGREGVMYSGGVTPVLRWIMPAPIMLEAGVGAHLVSHNRPLQKLSSAAQFSDIVGIYYRPSDEIQFGLRFMHLSNAGLKQPNMGVNFFYFHCAAAF